MNVPGAILVIHTAFIGDVVLVLPLLQVLRGRFPTSRLGIVTVPSSAGAIYNHPAVDQIHVYDKRGADRGVTGFRRVLNELRACHYDLALVPHRSLRSAALAWLARIPNRVGFDRSAGRLMMTERVPYEEGMHEIRRNLSLLEALGIIPDTVPLPQLYPSKKDMSEVETMLKEKAPRAFDRTQMIALAPGSIWETKRWPGENFQKLTRMLLDAGFSVVLIGGPADDALCQTITDDLRGGRVINAAGSLSLLQSTALLGMSRLAVSNDSAPMHLATGIGTPVIGIFGATAPSYGFAPLGPQDHAVGVDGLPCRPCAIHGGRRCPIGTLECMWGITPTQVYSMIQEILNGTPRNGRLVPS